MTRHIPPLLLLLCPTLALAGLPLVDFDRMGKVGLAGAFAGLDLFANSSSSSLQFDPSTSTLLSRNNDGSLTRIASTNQGGSILAGCALGDNYYIAGSFSSIGGSSAANVASYGSSSGSFSSLGSNGPKGEVSAIYCDSTQNNVWVGGRFTSPASAVAVWNTQSSSWSAPPFGGLSGDVLSITTNASQSSLLFSGSFLTSFGNGTITLNNTNNPNVPFSAGATPFSSSLVPVPLEVADITASASSTENGFTNVTNILCPAGADGPGDTWFSQDGTKAVITVRKFAFLSATGIRIGNTFLEGRGTTGFSVTTIPDNAVRELQFVDPTTGKNQTCTDPCPLLTDSSIPYQDFLFTDPSLDITGFILTLSEWQGAGPGLHLLQLLSSGAFASAVDSENSQSCFAPSPSNATHTGNWVQENANTDIPGTIQAVLVSDVDVGTPSSQGPTFTWMPYVSASGEYDVNLLVPGCTNFQDCPLRTSVKVTIFPGGGLPPNVQTVSQQNTADESVLIYSGPIVPTSDDFSMTVTMALADSPAGQGQGGKYELVADRVQLVLKSANVTGATTTTGSGSNGTSAGIATGFGFLEWPLSGGATVNASSAISNSSLTPLDNVGFQLFSAIGSSNVQSSQDSVAAVAQDASGTLYLGGRFNLSSGSASGASNVVSFKSGQLTALSNNGLNGEVTSMVLSGSQLFIGGSFTDSASSSAPGKLNNVAAYDTQANQWVPLQAGLDGPVASLVVDENGLLLVAGNFTSVVDGDSAAGFAAWNTTSKAWVNPGGFLVGKMTFVGNGTTPAKGQSQGQLVAGDVEASLAFGASGFVMLQNAANSNNGTPQVTPLNIQLQDPVSVNGADAVTTTKAKRHAHSATHSSSAIAWIPRITGLFKRQSTTSATLAPLPSTAPATAPAVLAGAFWTNSSSSREVIILGGNFSFTSSSGSTSQNLAVYDPQSATVTALQGNSVNGTIRSLLVSGNDLYVGGTFTVSGTPFNGFAVYDLEREQWDTVGSQTFSSSSGDVVVRSITESPSQSNTLIVAGSFAQVGNTPCRAVCSYNTQTKSFTALGNGVQGEAAAVAYAGDKRDTVVVGGSLALADGTGANVAEFAIANSTWAAVGSSSDLPGPVTALEVNDGNSSSIFAAGQSADGKSSFLFFWNGGSWNNVGSNFEAGTDFTQLVMVPLQDTHSTNSIVESDRMLWISGSLSDSSFGNASSALFDGEQIIPYIVSTSESGDPGVVASMFHSFATFSFTQRHFLATGIVILISIAIAAGVVFLLSLIGILWALFSRKDERLDKFDPGEYDDDDSTTHRPSSLLEHINAATRTTIIGQSPFAGQDNEEKVAADAAATSSDPFGPDASNFARAETPSDAIGGIMGSEEVSRAARARYSFDGRGDGELPMTAGQEIEILDDGDAAWWYARDTRTGKEGVVPAAYCY